MELAHSRSTTSVTRLANVIDGPILTDPHNRDRKFRMTQIVISYVLNPDGRWTVGFSISVNGTVLKKDGSDSVVTTRRDVYRRGYGEGSTFPPAFQAIVDALRPEGSPTLPFDPSAADGLSFTWEA